MRTKIAVIAMALACTLAVAQQPARRTRFEEALLIHYRLQQDGLPTTVAVIEHALAAVDKYLPTYFPDGPFHRDDLIAMAWLESGFHQHEIGTHGERGLYQIMPDEFAEAHITKDFYDIDVQTRMVLHVLRYKRSRWHDYKLTIQAYNGIVRMRDGSWSEKYWRAFVKRKIAVDELLGDR